MPTTAPSGLTFFRDQFSTGRWEGLAQFINGFNAASGGAIRLAPGNTRGRRRDTTFFTTNASFVSRRDPTSTGNTTWETLSNTTHTSIKVYRHSRWKYGSLEFSDLGLTTADGQFVWGQQFGALQAQEMLNSALAALTGAIEAIGTDAILDVTAEASPTLSFDHLVNGLAKMGDAAGSVRALALHSKPWFNVIGDALVNQKFAPEGANLVINEGTTKTMQRVPLVTDSSAFIETNGSPPPANFYKTLGLVAEAITVELNPADEAMEFGPIVGDSANTPANISHGLMVDYAFTLHIKGVRWKEASVDNPDATALADSSNWSLVASDRKLGPGFLIRSE